MDNKKGITEEYKEIWDVAVKLGEEDFKKFPPSRKDKFDSARDRAEKHLIGMVEMYLCRYGDPFVRDGVLNFLEKQLFTKNPSKDSHYLLTYSEWTTLRESIQFGKYLEEDKYATAAAP
jgi:hypothetical protein